MTNVSQFLTVQEYRGFLKGQLIEIVTSSKLEDPRQQALAIELLKILKSNQKYIPLQDEEARE